MKRAAWRLWPLVALFVLMLAATLIPTGAPPDASADTHTPSITNIHNDRDRHPDGCR